MARLDAALPPIWSRGNPVDIAGDSDEARYAAAREPLLDDGENDAVLVMNVPTALASDRRGEIGRRRDRAPSAKTRSGKTGVRDVDRRRRFSVRGVRGGWNS
jgi:acetyltransferase